MDQRIMGRKLKGFEMKLHLVLMVAIAILIAPGCAAFGGACAETAAQRAAAAALVSDAQLALDQASVVVANIASVETRHDAYAALDAAKAALRVSADALSATQDLCERVDVRAAFAGFAEAWRVLAPYLALLGGDGDSVVVPPLAVSR